MVVDVRFCIRTVDRILPYPHSCVHDVHRRFTCHSGKIAWRSIQRRGLASLLTTLSMALGVMLVVAVLLIYGIVAESFQKTSSLGYNVILGVKGGKLQLGVELGLLSEQADRKCPMGVL